MCRIPVWFSAYSLVKDCWKLWEQVRCRCSPVKDVAITFQAEGPGGVEEGSRRIFQEHVSQRRKLAKKPMRIVHEFVYTYVCMYIYTYMYICAYNMYLHVYIQVWALDADPLILGIQSEGFLDQAPALRSVPPRGRDHGVDDMRDGCKLSGTSYLCSSPPKAPVPRSASWDFKVT